jgi:hypothetical protein
VKTKDVSQLWWYIPIILALKRLKWEDHKFKVSLSYIERYQLEKPDGNDDDDDVVTFLHSCLCSA